jgi:hypothetical protein
MQPTAGMTKGSTSSEEAEVERFSSDSTSNSRNDIATLVTGIKHITSQDKKILKPLRARSTFQFQFFDAHIDALTRNPKALATVMLVSQLIESTTVLRASY